MKPTAALAAAAMSVLVWACSEPAPMPEGAQFHNFSHDGWPYGSPLEFVSEVPDSIGHVSLTLAVRHNDNYRYSNLWVEVATPIERPDSTAPDSMRLDTFNIKLADVYGKWYGRGAGVSYVAVDSLPGIYYYDKKRPARVRHIMRVDTLRDIEQIGLIFTPVHE